MKKVNDAPEQNVIGTIAEAEEKTGSSPSDATTPEEKTPENGYVGDNELPEIATDEEIPTKETELATDEAITEEVPVEGTEPVTEVVETPIAEEIATDETSEIVEPNPDLKVADVCQHKNMIVKTSRIGKAELTETRCPDCGIQGSSIFDVE